MAVSICSSLASIASASAIILRLISWRTAFSLFSSAAMASAFASSLVTKSSTADWACSKRPTALRRGAKIKPIFSEETLSRLQPLAFIKACKPTREVLPMAFKPRRTISLFSPNKGTISATVPKAANSVSSSQKSPVPVRFCSKAWHNLKETPTPLKSLKG